MRVALRSVTLFIIPTLALSATALPNLLQNFRVVLVGPSQAGNVGMIARSCANFECVRTSMFQCGLLRACCITCHNCWRSIHCWQASLHIVSAEYDREDDDNARNERTFAVQETAQSLLCQAQEHSTLAEALSGCVAAVGFTRRRGIERSESAIFVPVAGLASLPIELSGKSPPAGQVALVFGREASGLKSSELLQCTHACEIATSATQGSMSLPAAAGLALARTFEEALHIEASASSDHTRRLGGDTTSLRSMRLRPDGLAGTKSTGGIDPDSPVKTGSAPPATLDELEKLIERWDRFYAREVLAATSKTLSAVANADATCPSIAADNNDLASGQGWVRTSRGSRPEGAHSKATMLLRRLLQRARPSSRDLRLLHGVVRILNDNRPSSNIVP